MAKPQRISENAYILPGSGTVVTFNRGVKPASTAADSGNAGIEIKISTDKGGFEIWRWGKRNNLPTEREMVVQDNNIMGELLATKRDITLGSGLQCYRESYQDGQRVLTPVEHPVAAKAFFDKLKVPIHRQLNTIARNLVFHANYFVEYIRLGTEIVSMKAQECRNWRPEVMDDNGEINNYVFSGNWPKYSEKKYQPKVVPAYKGEEARQRRFVLHVADDLLNDEYLGIPRWWGGRTWIEVANTIPVFHLNNVRNGYAIRWHIEIPKDYFYDYSASMQTADGRKSAADKEKSAKETFLKTLNSFLAGEEQAGRALVTDYEINKQLGKEFPGIKVTALNPDLKDEALLKLFDKSNEANMSGSGVHPTLAAIQTQGKLSSGSEILNAFNMYVAIKTPVARELILESINLVHKANGWGEGLVWGFRDIQLKTQDQAPNGAAPADPNAAT